MGVLLSNCPGTWPELLDPALGLGVRARRIVEEGLLPVPEPITGAAVDELSTLSNTFGSLVVLLDPEVARAVGEPLGKLMREALLDLEPSLEANSAGYTVNVLSFVNAAACCGAGEGLLEPALVKSLLEELVKGSKKMGDELAYRCALVSLFAGEPGLAARFSKAGKLPARFKPGETFGFDMQGFVRYLATALEKGATVEQVRPAWVELVRAFPLKKGAETLDWNDLLWAARVVYHHLEQRPVASVGAALHAQVRSL